MVWDLLVFCKQTPFLVGRCWDINNASPKVYDVVFAFLTKGIKLIRCTNICSKVFSDISSRA